MGFFEFEVGDLRVKGIACCFCDEFVEPGLIDPVELTVTARSDRPRDDGMGVQTSWCHAKCLEATGMELHVTTAEYWEDVEEED